MEAINMRNYLLTGTSALALVIAAGAANAQTAPGKFDIKISGDAYFDAGFVSQDFDGGLSSLDFTNRLRLTISPVATADNGITYGALVRIRANGGDAKVDGDRAYIFVSGNFGTVRGGVVNGPSDDTYVAHPADFEIYGLYDLWRTYTTHSAGYAWGWNHGAAAASEGVQLENSHQVDTKLVYYTPRFFGSSPATGLQGGVSYEPTTGSVNTDVTRAISECGVGDFNCGTFKDVYEITANYVENFNGVGVKASAGYSGGTSAKDGFVRDYNDLESAQVGLQVSYLNFALGGGYVYNGDSGINKALNAFSPSQEAWNVGGQYTWGPVVVGVKFLEENLNTNTAGVNESLDAVSAGALYTVAPGLRTGLEYTHFENSIGSVGTLAPGQFSEKGDVVELRGAVTF
jgi:hypothetical protein